MVEVFAVVFIVFQVFLLGVRVMVWGAGCVADRQNPFAEVNLRRLWRVVFNR